MTKTSDFSMRLKQVREELGYTQAEMARFVGVSLRTYSRYENDERDIYPAPVTFLVEQGFSADWPLTGRGEMRTGSSNLDNIVAAAENKIAVNIARGRGHVISDDDLTMLGYMRAAGEGNRRARERRAAQRRRRPLSRLLGFALSLMGFREVRP